MNNQEEKEQFFAQHYGQEVIVTKGTYSKPLGHMYKIRHDVMETLALGSLSKVKLAVLLKPLHAITEEDKAELSEQTYQSIDEYGFNLFYGGSKDFTSEDIDILRSSGYALPWKGYSLKKLIEFGWIKTKE